VIDPSLVVFEIRRKKLEGDFAFQGSIFGSWVSSRTGREERQYPHLL
jgi:hypothetical protein